MTTTTSRTPSGPSTEQPSPGGARTFRPAAQVRQEFINFFMERASHRYVPSSPVVPLDDPTLLFANAGMNQFKPIFLGQTDFPAGHPFHHLKRAVNSQKCIRAGGKHNDLDDVGKDTYHHTFFEMLGNWSFGDYFKAEAIQWAWELLTGIWGLDPERLYATYFEGSKELGLEPDREAYDLWRRYLPPERILPGNMKDNFWEMGDTGPCGPCSEIHYDGRDDAERRSRRGDQLVNTGDPNVIEIWNLVFIQFNRTESGLNPLPAKHVDTGMGFERIVRVLQGKNSNYDTDVFAPLFAAIQRVCNAPPYTGHLAKPQDIAYRVIADHIRTLAFAITDGAEPSNEGRGYVLRRILRRAVRYGRQTLGVPGTFFADLVPTVVETMGEFFPELRRNPAHVQRVIRDEEEAFGRTLSNGLALFERAAEAAGASKHPHAKASISAEDAFKLHDTYGFPIDLTQLMAEERGMTVDVAGFTALMEQAREMSRSGGGAGRDDAAAKLLLPGHALSRLKALNIRPTKDDDKYHGRKIRATVKAIWNGENFDEHLLSSSTRPTDLFAVILDKTSFYAEQGGQVSDVGRLTVVRSTSGPHHGEFEVTAVRHCSGYVLHIGRILKGEIRVGEEVELRVDPAYRAAVASNHTATHLLNHSLRAALGAHVDQKGSLVASDRLRFDFSHGGPLSDEEIAGVERRTAERIAADLPVYAEIVPLMQARRINGVRAVFGETYPDPVRVVSIGVPVDRLLADPGNALWMDYSVEFCGGTHLSKTGEAGAFALVGEEGVSKGVRRVTALTGTAAKAAYELADRLLSRTRGAATLDDRYLVNEVKELTAEVERAEIPLVRKAELRRMIAALAERVRAAQKQEAAAGRDQAVSVARQLAEQETGTIIVYEIPADADRTALLAAMDAVRARHPDAAIMLISGNAAESKVTIVASVPQPFIARGLKAGDWVREVSTIVGGKGGGKAEAAQGGGTLPAKVPDAIAAARAFARMKAG